MRKVRLQAVLPLPLLDVWDKLNAIEDYPSYVTFLKKTIITDEELWQDITTILWIPMRFTHKNLQKQHLKHLRFQVIVPFNGHMEQGYILKEVKAGTQITGEVIFDLGNPFVDRILGPILEKRLRAMLIGTFQNVEKTLTKREKASLSVLE